jgi:hypothetical protein
VAKLQQKIFIEIVYRMAFSPISFLYRKPAKIDGFSSPFETLIDQLNIKNIY